MGRRGHVLVIPYPAQGHVNPLMHLSHRLANLGFKVTFVNTDVNHKRVISASNHPIDSGVNLVSIPDGMGLEDDRNDLAKLSEAISTTMPEKLQQLIQDINNKSLMEGDHEAMKITCIVSDGHMGWARQVAENLGIRVAVAWPSSAALFSLEANIPKLIDDGFIDPDGFSTKKQAIQLHPTIPPFDTENFPWNLIGDSNSQKAIFKYLKRTIEDSQLTEWQLYNSNYEIEPGAFSLTPNLHPIGPLMTATSDTETSGAQFWLQDSTCLKWFDQQPPQSVIYVAFGSFTVFDQAQFQELALGLELINKPFLWVVRPEIKKNDSKKDYPDGFQGRNGRIVGWVPQQKVLSHPAVACFICHCGWNSIMEGVSNGVPFLCWPYFGDQYLNEGYVCDIWKVGLGLDKDENGIIRKEEIKGKLEQLIGDKSIKERSYKLKKMVRNSVEVGGLSSANFSKFIKWLDG